MLGFETIGNATVTVFDSVPILTTDPWLTDNAYFGSWAPPYEIPLEQKENILSSRFVWISHGHPDHLSSESVAHLSGACFLVCDHVGRRIADGLTQEGMNVRILPDREWVNLSENIKVFGVSDYKQDSILLIDIGGKLLVNINDAEPRGTLQTIQKQVSRYKDSFLLKLFGYGDVDMMNCFEEDGSPIKSVARYKKELGAVGPQVRFWSELYGVNYVIPFSCFHDYQRTDSIWAREITTPIEDLYRDFNSTSVCLLPPHIRYDCASMQYSEIKPRRRLIEPKTPEMFQDSWSDELEIEDVDKLRKYFTRFERLGDGLDFIEIRCGTQTHSIDLNKNRKAKNQKGINFYVPRNSLMTCVEWEIFDDLLIGNYMKTSFIGDWRSYDLQLFDTYVGKIGDNGLARTEHEIKNYIREYSRRSPIEFIRHRVEKKSEQTFRRLFDNQSSARDFVKRVYLFVNK